MFGTFAITALLATLAGTAYADATPTVPGPGVIYKVGGRCHIQWNGDTASTTAWKNMAIELMTGDNFHMVHLTTVATGLDGTVTGSFDHPCPDVNPYSAIYFYQFSAPGASGKQWTTRFAIADASGQTTPPPESIQPISGAAIPWGTGKLVDPSSATPPPDFSNTGTSSSSVPASSTAPSSTLTSTLVTPTSTPRPSSSGSPGSSTPTPSKMVTVTTSKIPTGTGAPSAGSTPAGTTSSESSKDNGATDPDSSALANSTSTSTSTSTGSSSTPTPSKMVTVTTSKIPTSTSVPNTGSTSSSTPSSGSGKGNGAVGLDIKLWKTAFALGASAMAFALL